MNASNRLVDSSDALRVAVIGSGPAGIFTAERLADSSTHMVRIDVFDKLPTPFGLVRYGVAPDHLHMRLVRDSLFDILQRPGIRFIGNVNVGNDVSVQELKECYHGIVFAYGAAGDRRLGVPGEDLPGSIAATKLVSWYCGHPDHPADALSDLVSSSDAVAVLGMGNVAVDVTRVLAKAPYELSDSDMPQHVLDTLADSRIGDIYLIGRRTAAHANFTTKELRELGELADADVLIDPDDLVLGVVEQALAAKNRMVARNMDVLKGWAGRTAAGRRRRIHLRFCRRAAGIVGTSRVKSLLLEHTMTDAAGSVLGTGRMESLDVQLVVRAAGYRGIGLPGVPFATERGIIPNEGGRVLRDGLISLGEYAVGWIKRGPSGVIGTNKLDAAETAGAVLADADLLVTQGMLRRDIDELLRERRADVVHLQHWRRIDRAETSLGSSKGRLRTTLHNRDLLRAACQGED